MWCNKKQKLNSSLAELCWFWPLRGVTLWAPYNLLLSRLYKLKLLNRFLQQLRIRWNRQGERLYIWKEVLCVKAWRGPWEETRLRESNQHLCLSFQICYKPLKLALSQGFESEMGKKVTLIYSVCNLADKTPPEIPWELVDPTMYVKRIISLPMFARLSTACKLSVQFQTSTQSQNYSLNVFHFAPPLNYVYVIFILHF